MLAAALIAAAFLFARYLARPLRDLSATVERVGRGETPPPLPETGPSEIATLNRGVNRMMANLRQLEQDRALLLAGVSHDLRTPLARLRLGIEMEARDEATRAGMVDDIEEMDRIIGQFLEFARTNDAAAQEPTDANGIVGACVDRYVRAGNDVRFAAGVRAAGAAAAHRVLAPGRQPDRQRDRVRCAAGRRDDASGGRPHRARGRRPRARHRAGRGRAPEAAVHARVGGAHQRRRALPARGSASQSSTASRGCTAGPSICCRATAAARSPA